jgi:predicted nucleic acid-binding protein
LGKLPRLFESVSISVAVADETRRSFDLVGHKLVPSLKDHPWIEIEAVAREVLLEAMGPLFKAHGRRVRGAKASARKPEVGIVKGKVIAWTKAVDDASHLGFDVPDLESVLLAQRTGAIAVLDDRKALRAALDLGVRTATTREVLLAMKERLIIPDDAGAIVLMREAGYHATVRVANAWDGKQ